MFHKFTSKDILKCMIMKVEKITNVTVEKNTLKREASELISNGIMKMLEKNNFPHCVHCSSNVGFKLTLNAPFHFKDLTLNLPRDLPDTSS